MKIFGITGFKDSGKTTLVVNVVEALSRKGLKVSTIKHAHCNFDIDHPGRDSFRHREAGAQEVMIASNHRWAIMHELREQPEPSLDDLLTKLTPVDLVIIEGFKQANHPKIQVVRPEHNNEALPNEITNLVAIASDQKIDPVDYGCNGPHLDLNNTEQVCQFILAHCQLTLSHEGLK